MIQCSDCEYFVKGPGGQVGFKCDPFSTIKEPECLAKWQLLRTTELTQKIDRMVNAYEATLQMYKKIQPLQERMMKHMENELDEQDESDAWKQGYDDDEDDDDDEKENFK